MSATGICDTCEQFEAAKPADFARLDTCRCCPTPGCTAAVSVDLYAPGIDGDEEVEAHCEPCGRAAEAKCYANGWEPGSVVLRLLPSVAPASIFTPGDLPPGDLRDRVDAATRRFLSEMQIGRRGVTR